MDETRRPEDIDPGEPIAELADLEVASSDGFVARLSRRIERRVLGVEFVDLSRIGLLAVFRELWTILASVFADSSNDGRGNRK